MRSRKTAAVALVVVLALLGVPRGVGSQGGPTAPPAATTSTETYRQLSLFAEVLELVRAEYVDEVEDRQLIETTLGGMLSELDPHSGYMSAREYNELQTQTRGEFGGIGIEVTMEGGLVKVVSPIDDTPAAHAGIQPNDLIVEIDGQSVQGLTLQEASQRMRGPADSQIKLKIRRGNQDPFDVTLTRARIVVEPVRVRPAGDFGYVRIAEFTEQTGDGLRTGIQRLRDQMGDRLKGIVLDLRNNPGGLLGSGVTVADAFLDRGEIVSIRGRRQEDAQRFEAHGPDQTGGLPLVVLINGGSASAAEIVAGALQDHHRAIVLGTRSFGKGSVQAVIPLGNEGAIRLTIARYYTPSGRSIQAQGIDPDVTVEQVRAIPIEQPRTPREADLRSALRNNDQVQQPGTPGPQATAGDTDGDYQLARALDLLRAIALYRQRPAE